MANPSSNALTKRASAGLMLPPPPSKRIKRPAKVLDEDTYTSTLSHIIARDFFPGLLESETQQDYLDALESKDQAWISAAEARVRAVMTPGPEGSRARSRRGVSMTPTFDLRGHAEDTPLRWHGATPRSTVTSSPSADSGKHKGSAEGDVKESEPVRDLNLSDFQAKYTSEDNESFNKLLDKQNAKRAEKYQWMWNNNKLPSNRQIAQDERRRKLLEASKSQEEDGPNKSNQLVLLSHERDTDSRKASIDVRPLRPRNGLMFTPDDLEDAHPQYQRRSEAAEKASRAPPRAITFDNTRLPLAPAAGEDNDIVPASPSLTAIDAAIAGHPRSRGSLSSVAPDSVTGSETPRVNGYAFVDEEPTPEEIAASQLRHSPTRADHPVKYDAENSLLSDLVASAGSNASPHATPFAIASTSRREELHRKLVAKSAAAKRPQDKRLIEAQSSDRTPTPHFASSPRVGRSAGNLTPAAQKLYGSIQNSAPRSALGAIGDGGAFDPGNAGAWTPRTIGLRKGGNER